MTTNPNTSENQHPVLDWLRWLAVLPAAVGAYFASQVVTGLLTEVGYFFYAGRGFEDGWLDRPDYKSQFLCSIIGPYCLVWAGAKTAPRYRFVTALTLAVLHAVGNGSVVTLAIVRGMYQSASLWWLILSCVVGIISSIGACIQMRKEEDAT